MYRQCCEVIRNTLNSWRVQVEDIPRWKATRRPSEQIREHGFRKHLPADLKNADEPTIMRAWVKHKRNENDKREQTYYRNANDGLQYLVRVLREPFVDKDHPVCLWLSVLICDHRMKLMLCP